MSEKPFWWFDTAAVDKLFDKLAAAGDGARLEVHQVGDDKIHLVVVPVDGHSHDPINDSHLCPPSCP